jgi:hypothetical protein
LPEISADFGGIWPDSGEFIGRSVGGWAETSLPPMVNTFYGAPGKINPRTLDTRGGRPVLTGYRIFLMIGLDYTI